MTQQNTTEKINNADVIKKVKFHFNQKRRGVENKNFYSLYNHAQEIERR